MLSECSSAKDVKCRRLKVGRETNLRRALAYPRPGSPHTRHSLRACAALRTYTERAYTLQGEYVRDA